MDRFLSSFSDKSSGQKTLIVAGGGVVLLLFIVVSYFLTTPSKNNSQLPEQTVQPSSSIPFQVTKKTPLTENLVPYINSYYSINYPNSFSYEERKITEGGTSLVLKSQSQDFSNAIIEIQTYDASVASQSAVENVFLALNYQRSQIKIFNIPGVEYKGLISNGGVSLRETAVIFTYQNRVYKLQLMYSGETENNDIEQVFQRIVAGFKLSGY